MANRKQWIHGFYQNTFNETTGNWELRDRNSDALIAEAPKAAKLGALGAAMTRERKAHDKACTLDRQLFQANCDYSDAHRQMLNLQLEISEAAQGRADVEGLRENTRKSLLRIAKRRNIIGRHALTKEELVNVLSVD
jgi:hypothetical protein